MKSEDILALFDSFEKAATQINGIECWSARSLCLLLGYTDWRNFLNAIEKAKESCVNAGEQESDHFVGVNKMVPLGSSSAKEINKNTSPLVNNTLVNKVLGNKKSIA